MKATMYRCALAALIFAWVQPAHAEWVRRVTDGIMGTRITVELWADDKDKAEQAIDAVLDEMRHIDESMSTYKPTSEVSLVNAKAADGPMRISKELFEDLLPLDEDAPNSYGADLTWPPIVQDRGFAMGVIDCVPVDHSLRPAATTYHLQPTIEAMGRYLSTRAHVRESDMALNIRSFTE